MSLEECVSIRRAIWSLGSSVKTTGIAAVAVRIVHVQVLHNDARGTDPAA